MTRARWAWPGLHAQRREEYYPLWAYLAVLNMMEPPMPNVVRVCFYQSTGLIGKLIRWQTRAPVGHVALFFPALACYVEAVEGKGVVRRETDRRDLIDYADVTLPHYDDAEAWALDQVGKAYDYMMVARFITRAKEDPASINEFFCSEFVSHVLRRGGVVPLAHSDPWRESPGHLYLSPILFPSRVHRRS